jgi:nucleoside-diphosphate-sugar epimerase
MNVPRAIRTTEELEELLTRPSTPLIDAIRQITSPLLVFGASGKMGPTLCMLARRAAETAGYPLRIVALSRFTDQAQKLWLEAHGIETLSCDLLQSGDAWQLPDCENLIYLVGLKFGTQLNPCLTWAANTLAPARVAQRYSRARMVTLSTGNVYPFTSVTSRGASEAESPAPVGEYAAAALARERIFEYYSQTQQTPVVQIRLNYAVELRYGVLVDIAQKVWNQEAIDLRTGYLNCIWQGDANDMILRSLPFTQSPPAVYNLTGTAVLSVRELATELAKRLDRPVHFKGEESPTALLSDSTQLCRLLGPPPTRLADMLEWTAGWVRAGGLTLDKPTHFEVRTGRY